MEHDHYFLAIASVQKRKSQVLAQSFDWGHFE